MSIRFDDGFFRLPTDFLAGDDDFQSGGSAAVFSHPTKKPAAAVNRSDVSWDMLYAAVTDDLARMRLLEEANKNRAMFAETRNNHGHGHGHGLNGSVLYKYNQLRLAQFLKQQQEQMMMKQQESAVWGWNKAVGVNPPQSRQNTQNVSRNHLFPPPAPAWSNQNHHKQQCGSGMRAVFLANTGGSNRECAGTGVFLPRPAGSQATTRKKSGFSTVLLPDRVVQALNLNQKAMERKTHEQFGNNINSSKPINGDMGKAVNQEICLPPEWIY